MLQRKCDFKVQRFSDSLHFNFSHHCEQAQDVLTNNCIHIKSKNTIIYLSDDELEKLEIIKPILFNYKKEEISNIVKMVQGKPKEFNIKTLINLFNLKCGWFFTNGNKI